MLTSNPVLAGRSRLVPLGDSQIAARPWEIVALLACGMGAAMAVVFLDFSLRIPGHAILRSVLPMSLGLALVPRKGSGLVMSGAALMSLLGIGMAGAWPGIGATTSLLTIGPLLDLASRQARRGWQLAVAFGAAGLVANLLAFAVRGAGKVGGGGGMKGGAGPGWWSLAPVTYAVCGLVAGAVCALIWFRMQSGDERRFSDPGLT